MARPGGNTTGVSILATELDAKKLEILKEIAPAARHFGLLRDPASSFPARLEAIDILASPMLANFQQELVRLSLEYKLPAICQFREMVEAGCLASYGVKRPEMYALLAAFVDKMLRGARPSETVAQQPAAVELVINRKTARAIGIEVPPAILARADEVIE